jgi:hypothetical protein
MWIYAAFQVRLSLDTLFQFVAYMTRSHTTILRFFSFPDLDIISDKALIGFLKVVVELNRDRQILAYRNDERLVLGNDAFKLRMGFGLHAGWAIEGAVGSLQKVDATYLSPHVNMTARMEAASKQFGVPILMTERFHEVSKRICRHLSIIKIESLSLVLTRISILPSHLPVIVG